MRRRVVRLSLGVRELQTMRAHRLKEGDDVGVALEALLQSEDGRLLRFGLEGVGHEIQQRLAVDRYP